MKSFDGKVAAITGASSGIGRALALELAARGCDLALSSNSNQVALAETAELAAQYGVKVTKAKVDVADRGAVHAWADGVVHEHGRVNLIVNNAGVAFGGTVLDSSYEDFEWVMNINFWGVVHGTKAFLAAPRRRGRGPGRQHLEHLRHDRAGGAQPLQRQQVRGAWLHRVAAPGARHHEERRQRHLRAARRREDQRRPGEPLFDELR